MLLNGRHIDYWIKVTQGITGLLPYQVLIYRAVWHLDVDSTRPGGAVAAKGWPVLPLKCYVSWVQTVVRQVGSYLLRRFLKKFKGLALVRKELVNSVYGLPVVFIL